MSPWQRWKRWRRQANCRHYYLDLVVRRWWGRHYEYLNLAECCYCQRVVKKLSENWILNETFKIDLSKWEVVTPRREPKPTPEWLKYIDLL